MFWIRQVNTQRFVVAIFKISSTKLQITTIEFEIILLNFYLYFFSVLVTENSLHFFLWCTLDKKYQGDFFFFVVFGSCCIAVVVVVVVVLRLLIAFIITFRIFILWHMPRASATCVFADRVIKRFINSCHTHIFVPCVTQSVSFLHFTHIFHFCLVISDV